MEARKLDFIDALRGIAACYVALFHLTYIGYIKPPEYFRPFTDAGMSGVSLFFVVSAFTLSLSSSNRKDETTPTLNYLLRRFFRIAPLFWLWIAISCLRDWWRWDITHTPGEIAANATFVFNLIPSMSNGIPWAGWTIGVEMLFYVLFPVIFRGLNTPGKALGGLAIAAMMGGAWEWWTKEVGISGNGYDHFGLLSRIPIFVLGILVFHIHRGINYRWKRWGADYALIGLSVFCLMKIAYSGNKSAVIVSHDYQQALAWAALVLGLSVSPLPALVNSVSRFFGKISYSFYLTHATVINLLSATFIPIYAWTDHKLFRYLLCYAMVLVVTTAISYLTYRLVEVPSIRLGSRVIRWLSDRRKSAVGNSLLDLKS